MHGINEDEDYFDFKEYINSDDGERDFRKLVECSHCHKPVPPDAILCLYCGKRVVKKPVWIVYVALILIISFLIWLLFNF